MLPGVGENLTDHLEVYFQYRCKQPITLNGKLDRLSKLKIGVQWFLSKTGLGATNHFESCGFIRTRAGLEWPDIQYHYFPGAIRYDGKAAFEGMGFRFMWDRTNLKVAAMSASEAPSSMMRLRLSLITWRPRRIEKTGVSACDSLERF